MNEKGLVSRRFMLDIGPFGPIYRQYKHRAKLAIEQLSKIKSGEALKALYHEEIGYIDLVWGSEGTAQSNGSGLAKIAKYHPEVLDNMQAIVNEMKVVKRSENRVHLESKRYRGAVRLYWNENKKKWLLTLFEKK